MDRRKWTDDQLRQAVATQRSWRGVLRALGLQASSGGSIGTVRRRADSLNLDFSHFTGSRTWADEDLAEAVETSRSWPEVAERLGLAKDRRTGLRLKGDTLRLDIDIAHLEKSSTFPPLSTLLHRRPDLSALRHAAPLIAAAWFSLRGLPVALPSEPQRYDLLVATPGRVERVQVKSTSSSTSTGKWNVGIGHRPYRLEKDWGKAPYDPDDIDLFAIINGLGELYLIPIRAVAGLTTICLSAYEQYKVGDVSSLLN
jgi:hypothetical protein